MKVFLKDGREVSLNNAAAMWDGFRWIIFYDANGSIVGRFRRRDVVGFG